MINQDSLESDWVWHMVKEHDFLASLELGGAWVCLVQFQTFINVKVMHVITTQKEGQCM